MTSTVFVSEYESVAITMIRQNANFEAPLFEKQSSFCTVKALAPKKSDKNVKLKCSRSCLIQIFTYQVRHARKTRASFAAPAAATATTATTRSALSSPKERTKSAH